MRSSPQKGFLILKAFEAFVKGYKPAHFAAHIFVANLKYLQQHQYPSAYVRDVATLFFQNEDLRDQYIAKSDGLPFASPEFKEVLGVTLGYPPIAARFFADRMRNPSLEQYTAVFDYAGRYFGGHIDDTQVIAEWLWSNVPNYPPSEIAMTYQDKQFRLLPDEKEPVILNTK